MSLATLFSKGTTYFALMCLMSLIACNVSADDADNCRTLFSDKEYIKAVSVCRSASIDGDTAAKYFLGMMYFDGLGLQEDQGMGINLLRSAAYLSHSDAMVRLGFIFWNGELGQKDEAIACDWWERAAGARHAVGLEKYGVCYMLGRGREKDIAKAHFHLKEAANLGSASAVYIVNRYKALFPSEHQALSTSK